jgi:hypothetical protein
LLILWFDKYMYCWISYWNWNNIFPCWHIH